MTEQPLTEVPTEKIIDEVASRGGGLEALAKRFADMTLQSILRHLINLPGVESVELTLSSGKKLEERKTKPSEEKDDERAC